ncbi:MAG: DUF3299 domain-containing protein [Pirellulales bacterium]
MRFRRSSNPRVSIASLAAALLALSVVAGCDHASVEPASSAAVTPPAEQSAAQTSAVAQPAETATAATPTAVADAPAPAAPAAEPTEAVTRVVARPASPGKPRDITFDTIKFDIEKDQPFFREMLTPAIEKLFGQSIRIRGFIYPTFQQSGITSFVLVRDNQECCFGPGAALFDCIVVEMKPGKSTDYSIRPVTVEGTFGFSELKDPDGIQRAIFHLDGESVR